MTNVEQIRRRPGPKPHNLTPAEEKARRQEWKRRAAAKTRSITIDKDLVSILNTHCDRLEPLFGFRPTLSQCLRYMLKETAR